MPGLMGSNHHVVDDRGDINPLRVKDGIDEVGSVISETIAMCGG